MEFIRNHRKRGPTSFEDIEVIGSDIGPPQRNQSTNQSLITLKTRIIGYISQNKK